MAAEAGSITEWFAANPYGVQVSADGIAETLEFLDDWEERYTYIIDLGRALPGFPEALKTEDRLIRGCQSQVWLEHAQDTSTGRLLLAVDSDALIVRGLAAIALAAFNNKTAAEIKAFDIDAFFTRIDLMRHLSPTRGNGLRAMVTRIRQLAAD